MPSSSPSYDVFISYSWSDKPVARRIEECLVDEDLRVFRDDTNIDLGELYPSELEKAIQQSRVFLSLVSKASLESAWVAEEQNLALRLAKRPSDPMRLVPVLLGGARAPGFLGSRKGFPLALPIVEAEVRSLCSEIGRLARGRSPRVVAVPKLPAELDFLLAFPDGLLASAWRSLARSRKVEAEGRQALSKGLVRRVDADGIELFALDLEVLARERAKKPDAAGDGPELLRQLVQWIDEQRPFAFPGLGRGLALLVRDLLPLAQGLPSDDDDGELRGRVVDLARQQLPTMIAENQLSIAVAVTARLNQNEIPTLQDRLLYGSLLLHVGKPHDALQQLEAFRGDELFDDPMLTVEQRLDAARDWAMAVKDSGRAKDFRDDLLSAYGRMLELVDDLADGPGKLRLRGDLLNNRATQLATFSDGDREGLWKAALEDLDEASSIFRNLEEPERVLGVEANRVALSLDRLGDGETPAADLLGRLELEREIIAAVKPGERLFFFFYQRARLLRRRRDLEGAEREYGAARRVAEAAHLGNRAAKARLGAARAAFERDLDTGRFLEEAEICAAILWPFVADAWSANALFKLLAHDLVDVNLLARRRDEAWDALRSAINLELLRAGGKAARFRRHRFEAVVAQAKKIRPDRGKKDAFIRAYPALLSTMLGVQEYQVSWNLIETVK